MEKVVTKIYMMNKIILFISFFFQSDFLPLPLSLSLSFFCFCYAFSSKMLLLSSFILFSSFILINSTCERHKPRKEGFLRQKSCIPGFYEGSCLIILPPETLHNAIETCQYDYGGRLATAPTNDAIQTWVRTIHFNADFPFNKDSRFWIGYGRSGFQDIGSHVSNFVNESFWDRVFEPHSFSSTIEFESDENYDLLDDSECPIAGTVFNPVNKKFSAKRSNEIHYSLCEAPRWVKLQCNTGWYLIPQLRMCVHVHPERVKFLQAHAVCNREGSFIATAQNGNELEMLRDVIVPMNLDNPDYVYGGGFWGGLKSEYNTTFSMDGTEPLFEVLGSQRTSKKCVLFFFLDVCDDEYLSFRCVVQISGSAVDCEPYDNYDTWYLPYMCQRFADQSLSTNV